jgi:hypothetical protein
LYAIDEASANWAGTTGLHEMVEAAYRAAWDLILAKWQDYAITSRDFTISSGNSHTLIADSPAANQIARTLFYKLRMVQRQFGDGKYKAIESFGLEESGEGDVGLGYMFLGDVIYIETSETAAGNYRAWCIPTPAALSGDSSVIVDPVNGAVLQYVIDVVCKRLRAKDDLSPGAFEKFAEELEARIDRMGGNRDARPRKIPDVRARMGLRYRSRRLVS